MPYFISYLLYIIHTDICVLCIKTPRYQLVLYVNTCMHFLCLFLGVFVKLDKGLPTGSIFQVVGVGCVLFHASWLLHFHPSCPNFITLTHL